MKRVAVVLLVVLLLLHAVCLGWFIVEARTRIAHKREVAALEIPRVLALLDARIGNAFDNPVFAKPEGDDAGELLNARIDFTGHPAATTLLPEHCVETFRKYFGKTEEVPIEQLDGCDSSVLHELQRFGRWTLTTGPRATLAAGPRGDDALPNFLVLQSLAKVHLLKGHASGHFAEAAADVRHLAQLLFTQEYLYSAMFGIALLSITQHLAESLGEPDEFPLSKVQLADLRVRLFTSEFSISTLAPPATAQNTSTAPRFVRCVVLTEQAFMSVIKELPADAECSFEDARFELAHPWKQNEQAHLELLSGPAQLGGRLARVLFASQFVDLEAQLLEAEELPADGEWETGRSELTAHLLSKH